MGTDNLQRKLARAMRTRREAMSISQEGFADLIGLHRTYYSSIERGERNVSLKNLERIAIGLDLLLSQLIQEAESLNEKAAGLTAKPKRKRASPHK